MILFLVDVFVRASDHLSDYTAKTPNVNCLIIILVKKNDFWCSVPSGTHCLRLRTFLIGLLPLFHVALKILRHVLFKFLLSWNTFLWFFCVQHLIIILFMNFLQFLFNIWLWRHYSCESKITNLDTTWWINEKVSRFEISMNYIGGMDIAQCWQLVIEYCRDCWFVKLCLGNCVE